MSKKSLISLVALLVMACSARAAEKTVEATRERVLELYSTAPAAFIENAGQIADPTVRYVFCGSGANIFHTTKGPVFQLFQQEKPGQDSKNYRDEPAGYRGLGRYDKKDVIRQTHSFSMRFIGAKGVRPIGHGKQETKVNYFIGGDPNKWHTDVATYSEVVYPELYDGISLHTFGRKSHLKYEFHIAAGADYKQIVVTYKGAGDIKIDSNGALHINTPLGELVDGAPYIYQIINGRQVQIPGRYRLIDENSYTFEIRGRVDPKIELVIDPQLLWARFLGGRGNETAYGIAVDTNGNALLTGCTYSSSFEGATIDNTNSYGNRGNFDAFVAKVSSSGELLWITFLCGTDDDRGYGIAEGIDEQGPYVIVTGATASSDPVHGIPMVNAFQYDNAGGIDAFVAKLYSSGDLAGHLRWSSYLGGTGYDHGYGIAVDSLNSKALLLTGASASKNFSTCSNCDYSDTGSYDVFVAKIADLGIDDPQVEWCDCRGGSEDDIGYGICVDALGNSLVVGASASLYNFTTTVFTNYGGGKDVFVAKFDPNGHIEGSVGPFCGWLGGSEDDEGYGIATGIDKNGFYALLTGYTKSDDFPQVQGYCCGADAFVARINYLNPNQTADVAWVKCVAGSGDEQGRDIATGVDDEGTTYGILTGWTSSYDFPANGLFKDEHSGRTDAFVARVNENISGDAGSLDWAGYLGGGADDKAYGIDEYVDLQGNRYAVVVGETNSVDWDIEYNGSKDIFVARIRTDGIIGQGKLYGTVWKTDGTPISGAEVNVPGQETFTDGEGNFSFDSEDSNPETSDILAGRVPVMVKKDPNYYPAMKIVRIDANSTTHVNIVMAPLGEDSDKPVVVALSAYFCGPGKFAYYMDGPTFYEKFTTTIDWPISCEPNKIEWRITCNDGEPNHTYITDCSGTTSFSLGNSTTHSRCFDMGSDFGVGGTLEVVAVGSKVLGNDVNSIPRAADFFEVIAPPPYVVDANKDVAVLVNGDGFEYKMLVPGFDMAKWSRGNTMPFFKGENMNVGVHPKQQPTGPRIIGMVYSDGTSDVFTEVWDADSRKQDNDEVEFEGGIELPKLPHGIEAEVKVNAQFSYTYSLSSGIWMPSGGLDIECVFSFTSPYYYVAVIGPVPVYSAAELNLALGLSSSLRDWGDMGPKLSSSFYFEPLLKGIIAAGFGDAACVEGYLGGGFHAEVDLWPELQWGGQYIVLVGGVDVYIGSFSVGGGELRYSWWPNPGESKIIHERGFGPVGTDYRDPGVSADLGMNEEIVEPNEFPYCVPKLVPLEGAVLADNMLMVWLHDDRSRDPNDRTELRYATYHNGNWQKPEPGAIADDGTADMNPQLISLGSGMAACIWQDAKDTLAGCSDLQTLNEQLEIAVWMYDSTMQQWTNTATVPDKWLTDDNYLDRSPKLAGYASKMLAVWIKNESNDMWGNANTAPNKIMSSKYTNGSWGGLDTLALDQGAILGTALAYNPNNATYTYVFCVDSNDTDPNINLEQQELYMATCPSSGGWSGPYLLTDNDISDSSPRLIYDPNGKELLLFWIRGDEVRMAEESSFVGGLDPNTESSTVPSPNGLQDFDVLMGQQGQIALMWSNVSVPFDFPKSNPNLSRPECIEPNCIRIDPEYYDPHRLPVYMNPECVDPNLYLVNHDIWVSYRDSYFGLWSMPRQLTWDDAAERSMSGAFESDGTLLCVYNKRQTEYKTVDCNCTDCNCNEPNHHTISVANVPSPGKRSDLVYLNDDLKPDLSIEVKDVKVLPPNPMPGTWAKVSANVKNLGISSARNIVVLFSDDSGAGIWTPAPPIVGPLVGGAASEVSVWWKVPPSVSPRTVTVAIQSFDGKTEDPNNNSVSFEVLAPDLTIREMNFHSIGPDTRVVTVRVANEGVLPIGTNLVVLRKSDSIGQYDPYEDILSGEYIQDIDPIAYQDVPFTLSSGQLSGVERIYATVEIIPFDVVDNFESYTSNLNDVWEGSPDVPDGGLAYLETDVVHFGEQSMQFLYNNAISGHSVLRRIYGSAQDWTEDSVTTLRLHFYGDANDGADGGMSVLLEDSDGVSAEIAYEGDAGDLSAKVWLEWEIDLQDFSANNVDPNKIKKMELHITGGTTGRIYFDDILLYSHPTDSIYFDDVLLYSVNYVPGDMNGDCVFDNADLKIMSQQWLKEGSDLLADLDGKNGVNFIDYSIFSDHWNEEYARPTYLGPIHNVNEFNEDNNIRAVRIR